MNLAKMRLLSLLCIHCITTQHLPSYVCLGVCVFVGAATAMLAMRQWALIYIYIHICLYERILRIMATKSRQEERERERKRGFTVPCAMSRTEHERLFIYCYRVQALYVPLRIQMCYFFSFLALHCTHKFIYCLMPYMLYILLYIYI